MGCIGSNIDNYNAIEDACYGLCIGSAIGDSLGSYCEFEENISQSQIDIALKMPGGGTWGHRLKSGQVTDDTELAISLAKGLCQMLDQNTNVASPIFDIKYIAKQYEIWYKSDPFDIGGITKQTLKAAPDITQCQANAIKCHQDKLKKFKEFGTMGNGSMMRCMPLIVYGHKLSTNKLFEIIKLDSSLTHSNDIVYYINTCYAVCIQYLIINGEDELQNKAKAAFKCAQDWITLVAEEQKQVQNENENMNEDNKYLMGSLLNEDNYERTDYAQLVLEWLLKCTKVDSYKKLRKATSKPITSLRIAFERSFFHLYHCTDFVTAISQTVMEGGDTDTNACIVGGMLGALYGINKLPIDYVNIIKNCIPALPERDNQFQARLYFDDKLIKTLIDKASMDIDIKSY